MELDCKTKNLESKNKKYYILLFCVVFSNSQIINSFNTLIRSVFGDLHRLDTLFLYLVFLFLLIKSIPHIVHSIKKRDVIYLLLFFSIFLISIFRSEFRNYNSEIPIIVLYEWVFLCIPIYFIGLGATNFSKLRKYSIFFSFVILFSIILDLFVKKDYFNKSYSQYLGYQILPAVLIFLLEIMEGKIIFTPLFSFSFIFLLMSGARGPLACVLLVGVLYFILFPYKRKKGKWILAISLIIIFLLFIYFLPSILNSLLDMFSRLGMSTRIISRLNDGSLSTDNARLSLYKTSLAGIADNPFFGLGILNDRFFLWQRLAFAENSIGMYPHNIFLEILLQFGIVAGCLMILFLGKLLIKSLLFVKEKDQIWLVSFLCGIGLFPLFFSGSYINYYLFYLFLGACVSINRKKQRKNIHENIDKI